MRHTVKRFLEVNTPNANIADRSVVARHESHESEASQSLIFCCDNVSPEKSCSIVVNLVCFCLALPIRFCVPECHQKEVKSSTAKKLVFFVSAVASEGNQTKERSS